MTEKVKEFLSDWLKLPQWQQKWLRSKYQFLWWVEEYVYIENKDDLENPIIKLDPWPKQREVLMDFLNERLCIVLKARQLGLTWLALVYAAWRMIFFPGFTASGISKTEGEALELIRRMKVILQHLPDWMVMEWQGAKGDYRALKTGIVWAATASKIEIRHPKMDDKGKAAGELISRFQGLTAAADAGRSFTDNLIILDEWAFQQWAEEIWTAGFPTVNRPTGGQVIGLSTNKRGSFFESLWQMARKGDVKMKCIFLGWDTDPRRTQEWYEETKAALPNSYMQEYPKTETEAMSAGELTAFPEFSYDIHVCQPFDIPLHWRRFRCNDNGYTDPFAWYWLAVSEDGQVFVYREYTRDYTDEKVHYTTQAEEVVKRSYYTAIEGNEVVKYPEKYDYTVLGHEAWAVDRRYESNKSLVDFYTLGGLSGFLRGVRDPVLRKAVMHEYLKPYPDPMRPGKLTAKLQIFSTCHKLIETIPMLVVDEKNNEKVEDSRIDHWYEGLTNGLATYHAEKSNKRPEDESRIARDKRKKAKMLARSGQRWRYGRR